MIIADNNPAKSTTPLLGQGGSRATPPAYTPRDVRPAPPQAPFPIYHPVDEKRRDSAPRLLCLGFSVLVGVWLAVSAIFYGISLGKVVSLKFELHGEYHNDQSDF